MTTIDNTRYEAPDYAFDGPRGGIQRTLDPVSPTIHCEQWSFPGSLIALTVAVESTDARFDANDIASLYIDQHAERGSVEIRGAGRLPHAGGDDTIGYTLDHVGQNGEPLRSLLGVARHGSRTLVWHVTTPAGSDLDVDSQAASIAGSMAFRSNE